MNPAVSEAAKPQAVATYHSWEVTLFPHSAGTPPLPSTYVLRFTPRTALLAPICCDGVTERRQPCLGLELEDSPFA